MSKKRKQAKQAKLDSKAAAQVEAPVKAEERPASTTAFPLGEMKPSEELQIYYNDAYLREKQRFNQIFGIIDQPEPVKEKVYVQPSPDEFVPIKKYKSTKRTANAFIVISVIACVAVAVLAALLLLKQ